MAHKEDNLYFLVDLVENIKKIVGRASTSSGQIPCPRCGEMFNWFYTTSPSKIEGHCTRTIVETPSSVMTGEAFIPCCRVSLLYYCPEGAVNGD